MIFGWEGKCCVLKINGFCWQLWFVRLSRLVRMDYNEFGLHSISISLVCCIMILVRTQISNWSLPPVRLRPKMVRSDPLRIKAQNDKKACQSTPFSVKLHLVLVMINPCAMPAPVKTAIWGRTARPFPVPCNAALQKMLCSVRSCNAVFQKTATLFLETATQF